MNLAKRVVSGLTAVLAFAAILCFSGCQPYVPPSPESGQIGTGPAATAKPPGFSVFQPGDLVRVEFSGLPVTDRLPPHEENIKEDGTITMQLVGTIRAAGKTSGDLQKELQEKYREYFKNAVVTVKGADLFYFVGGQVKQPARFPHLGPITVTAAIKSAGDFTDYANKKKVKLTRADGKVLTVNCQKILGGHSELDLPVYPGDIIDVPQRIF